MKKEDIIVFSISIVENSIHKEIDKAIIFSKQITPEQQLLSSRDITIIEMLKEISESQKNFKPRKENFERKAWKDGNKDRPSRKIIEKTREYL